VGALGFRCQNQQRKGGHKARPYIVIELRKAQGESPRRPAPWFRIHPAERRVGQALPLRHVIAFTPSNGA
jgi:hypothetical protein